MTCMMKNSRVPQPLSEHVNIIRRAYLHFLSLDIGEQQAESKVDLVHIMNFCQIKYIKNPFLGCQIVELKLNKS